MNARTPAALAATTLALLAVAGCSNGSGAGSADAPSSGGAVSRPQPDAAGIPANERGPAQRDSAMSAFDATTDGLAANAPARAANAVEQVPDVQAPWIISTGTVSLYSDDVSQARFDLMKVVDEHRGEVSDEQTATDDDGKVSRSRLVLRIPSGDFGDVMDELARIPGTDLKSAKRSSEDVTTQVIDTAVRVRAQKASIDRIEALLARAQNLRSIIWIEGQLTRRQSDLDSLEQQQAYLEDQTTLSTITVYLEQTPRPKAAGTDHRDATGFMGGLRKGWHALAEAGTAAATAVGAVLPFGVLAALIGFPAWLVVRRRRATTPPPAPAD